jgi:putative transposase
MARKPRVWYPNAAYHVTARGNHKGNIFLERSDYITYLQFLHNTKIKHPFLLHAYCLMTNHVHLLIQTTETPLWSIMKLINMRYACYLNSKQNTSGHLFQGRYGAEPIESDNSMMAVSRYIHLNPVKAHLVETPEDYEWSSYRIFMGTKKSALVNPASLFDSYGPDAINHYRLMCAEAITTMREAEKQLALYNARANSLPVEGLTPIL